MTYSGDFGQRPAVDQPSARLSADPRPGSADAARRAVGKTGVWRERIFRLIFQEQSWERGNLGLPDQGTGLTSVEISELLGLCGACGRGPLSVNLITTRLGELADGGWITRMVDDQGETVQRRNHEGRLGDVWVLTSDGWQEGKRRYHHDWSDLDQEG